MKIILGLILSYILGSTPTAYLVAKKIKNVDIRRVGSGNVGATNAMRAIGTRGGLIVLVVDILKGLLPVTIIATLCLSGNYDANPLKIRCLFGFFAFLGHNWSCFLSFKGGKGVATAAGVFLGLVPGILLIAGGVWVIVVFATRYVSLGSILSAVSIPMLVIILNKPPQLVILSIALSILVVYRHKANINRLIHGVENKLRKKR